MCLTSPDQILRVVGSIRRSEMVAVGLSAPIRFNNLQLNNLEFVPPHRPRPGARPKTSNIGPHRQMSQQSSPALWGELVARAMQLEGVVEGHSSVSPASSRALLLLNQSDVISPETSLSRTKPLEPVHIHGVFDTSVHACLPEDRARAICEMGWGEPHPFGEYGTEVMIYGPRDEQELQIILRMIQESLEFARVSN